MKYEIYLDVPESGEISDRKRKEIGLALNNFRGKRIRLTVERFYNKRSQDQNEMWWSWMKLSGDYLGYTKEEMHELCKRKFLDVERFLATIKETGKRRIFAKDENVYSEIATGEVFFEDQLLNIKQENTSGSTKVLSTVEFSELADDLDKWLFEEFGVRIPMPGESWQLYY